MDVNLIIKIHTVHFFIQCNVFAFKGYITEVEALAYVIGTFQGHFCGFYAFVDAPGFGNRIYSRRKLPF
jgi:hypothetical protein